ncbi:unnamed protein product [Vitrella brassicaformis CCMP3155]|uniref:Secreted protein n=1 Tax=Vitrella brassicaformis (strain CCMP3155) TaxID=1169540 RepID=A0A0G4GFV3_VITBC|nr:unnamed protein product [Vitrella brassicaformis CCMP3155]|eukprot:CEM28407.1 unnamed protein product [Vitrella brassicaformis CCMP3155]
MYTFLPPTAVFLVLFSASLTVAFSESSVRASKTAKTQSDRNPFELRLDDRKRFVQEGDTRPYGGGQYEYLSPRPKAAHVNEKTSIALREGRKVLDGPEEVGELFRVEGEKTGTVHGQVVLARDGKTLLFYPRTPLARGEEVTVTVRRGLRVASHGQSSDEGALEVGGYEWSFTIRDDEERSDILAEDEFYRSPDWFQGRNQTRRQILTIRMRSGLGRFRNGAFIGSPLTNKRRTASWKPMKKGSITSDALSAWHRMERASDLHVQGNGNLAFTLGEADAAYEFDNHYELVVIQLGPHTKTILWRLGGGSISDFTFIDVDEEEKQSPDDPPFIGQHSPYQLPNGNILMLWSWCCGGVHLINTTESDAPILAIGWGATDVFYNEVTYESEPKIIREFSGFSPNRVYLQPWEGFSNDPPRLLLCSDYAKDPDSFGELDDWTLHMAYNGVTGITKWRVYVDTSPETLAQQKAGEFLVEIPKQDFEETLSLKSVRQLMDVTGNKSIEYSGKDAICASRPSQGQGRNPHAIENDQSASGSL